MQEPSIFTRIINGEIPCQKIYEDEKTFAFLDIFPAVSGHTLVIPKVQVDKLEDLSDDDYAALMQTVKKVMKRVTEVYGVDYRACIKVMGFDVPHAHIHVLPCRGAIDFNSLQDKTHAADSNELEKVAKKLAF